MPIRAIVTDIEGTTSSISFVHDVLFPYAREHLPAFVRTHADDPDVRHWLGEAAREGGVDAHDPEAVIELLIGWIDADRKATPLKALQGMIWKNGYASGAYRAHVYAEVPARLRAWHEAGLALYVYSSGSVPAQKLFFSHSQAGDLTPLFRGYFDTETGPKREADAYRRIAERIGMPAANILFLSDVTAELDAAREAGMRTTLLCRPPTTCPAGGDHPCVTDFDAIKP
jgi:enolase-phosphatase E1